MSTGGAAERITVTNAHTYITVPAPSRKHKGRYCQQEKDFHSWQQGGSCSPAARQAPAVPCTPLFPLGVQPRWVLPSPAAGTPPQRSHSLCTSSMLGQPSCRPWAASSRGVRTQPASASFMKAAPAVGKGDAVKLPA